MRRGDVWTLRDDRYASKARPVVIVQSDLAGGSDSVILTLLTTSNNEELPNRVSVQPTPANGLRQASFVMAEKLLTVRRSELGIRVGALTDAQMHTISAALATVLGITADDIPINS